MEKKKKHDDDQPKAADEENPAFSDQIPTTTTTSTGPSLLDHMFQTPLPLPPPPPEMASTTSENSTSISSSSTEVTNDTLATKTAPRDQQHQDQKTMINEHELKPKKKNTKRIRQPRFAFMTKSDVDNLDDGYRWRKYGQKAVKNSPFPRSYYRCTASSCGVKKRVERSSQDPSIVVTTYEGTHTHQCPVSTQPPPARGGAGGNNINIIGPVLVPHDQMATGSSIPRVMGDFISQPYNYDQDYQFYNHPLPILSTTSSTTPLPLPLPFDYLSTNYINNPYTTTTTSSYNPLLSDIFIDQERFNYYPPSSSSSPSPSPSSSSTVRDSGLLQDMIMPSKARDQASKDIDHDQL